MSTGGTRPDPYAQDAGAYVLGALDVEEAAAFEAHLARCPGCHEAVDDVAHLPGLLAAVPPDGLADPPPSVLTGVLAAVRDATEPPLHRRRRLWTGAAVLGAAAAGFLAGVVLPGEVDAGASDAVGQVTTVALEGGAGVPVSASVDLEVTEWGTRLVVTCAYDGDGDGDGAPYGRGGAVEYALVVLDRDGRAEPVATWVAAPGGEVAVPAATAWALGDIAGLQLRAGADVVLSADL